MKDYVDDLPVAGSPNDVPAPEIDPVDLVFYVGAHWPPKADLPRLKNYAINRALYEGKHREVFQRLNKIFKDHEAEHQKLVLIFNFHRRLSNLWGDLTFGEPPLVKIQDEAKRLAFKRFSEESNQMWNTFHKAVVDISRFGLCVLRLYYSEAEGAKLDLVPPSNYYPITNPVTEETIAHCIAWTIDAGETYKDHVKVKYLRVEIHRPGTVENRIYRLQQDKIYEELSPDEYGIDDLIETGVDYPLIFPVIRETTSTSKDGEDDYEPIDTIIERLEMRMTRVGRILDYYSEPDKAVPESGMDMDDSGEVTYDHNKKVWPIYEGGALPQYITWAEGGVLQAAYTDVDKAMQMLYMVSETCKAAFDLDGCGALSGRAIRLLLTVPLKKAKRLGALINPYVKKITKAGTELEKARGFKGAVVIDDLTFTPRDGLPNDRTETIADMVSLRGVGGVTDERMVSEIFELEGEELAAFVAQVKKERTESNTQVKISGKIGGDQFGGNEGGGAASARPPANGPGITAT